VSVRDTPAHCVGGEDAHVVFPADPLKSDGVDILIEDDSNGDGETKDAEALGADGEGENLEGVRQNQGPKGKVVRSAEQENEDNDSMSSRTALGNGVTGRTNGLEYEEN
jgi:hypothetical protein